MNVIPFPCGKKEESIRLPVDDLEFALIPDIELLKNFDEEFFPDNRFEFVRYMRVILSEEDYAEFLEATTCKEFFEEAQDDIKAICEFFFTLEH